MRHPSHPQIRKSLDPQISRSSNFYQLRRDVGEHFHSRIGDQHIVFDEVDPVGAMGMQPLQRTPVHAGRQVDSDDGLDVHLQLPEGGRIKHFRSGPKIVVDVFGPEVAASARPAVKSLASAATPASAELLLYDPFLIGSSPSAGQYAADAPLGGQNPTLPTTGAYGTMPDFLSGPWVAAGASTHGQSKSPPGLNYIGAPAQGGSIGTVLDTVANNLDTRVGRYFKPGQEWTDATVGTYYISWLENFGTIPNVGDDMGFRSFEMWRTTAAIGDPNLLGDFGYNAYYNPTNQAQRQAATAHMQFQFQPIDGSPVLALLVS